MFQPIPQRACRRCHFTAKGEDEVRLWFRARGTTRGATYQRVVCDGCRQDEVDGRKRVNRFRAKARSTFQRHATKYIKAELATDPEDFAVRFGWDVARIEREMRHAYENGCGECGEHYEGMGHGPQDITIDIWDPAQPPYYGSNTRLICNTCNKAKGDLPPQMWGLKKALWRRWKRWVAERPPESPPEQLGLALVYSRSAK